MARHTACFCLVALLLTPVANGQAAADLSLRAPDGTMVEIDRDEWGAPHISAETEAAVFFGQGFAAAQDRLFQMENFWRASTGRLAEAFSPDFVENDRLVRTFFYTPAERQAQFDALPAELQMILTSFKDGVNTYIDSVGANPQVYQPVEYAQPPFTLIGIEDWDVDKMVAIMQFFMRRFGEFGGQELARLGELQANGPVWLDENRPINDPTAPTTIPAGGTAGAGLGHSGRYSAQPVPKAAEVAARTFAWREAVDKRFDAIGVPRKFGSYAALIGTSQSSSGDVMLLGAPQMGEPGVSPPADPNRAVTWEAELLVGDPAAPTLHVAGMTVPGIPGIIIGRTPDRAWTLTSGLSDNVDTFVEATEDNTLTRYFFNGQFVDYEAVEETIPVLGGAPVMFPHYRSVHGPVYASDLDNQQAFTWQYTFWEKELDMMGAFYELWKAESESDVDDAMAAVPMSFNFFLNNKAQDIRYWHIGFYPERPGTADPRLPLAGDGTQEWDGIRPFADLPKDENTGQGYYVNWNNKPAANWDHGDLMPWTDGAGRTYDGVLDIENVVLQNAPLAFDDLKEIHAVVDMREYPGTYQQIVLFSENGSRAENLIPPGQSAFYNAMGQPSPHTADQWIRYQSYEMKSFTFVGASPVAADPAETPRTTPQLLPTYPNPLGSGTARIVVEVAEAGAVRVDVLDMLGRTVVVLADRSLGIGIHHLDFEQKNLGNGLYVVRLQAGDHVQARKLVVAQ